MRATATMFGTLLLSCFALTGCISVRGPDYAAELVRDLSDVAGCRFVSTIRAPRVATRLNLPVYDDYLAELRRRTVAAGGTHLFIMNDAASWGGVEAAGAAYRCT